jgi:lysophospholipase L1-like esterase
MLLAKKNNSMSRSVLVLTSTLIALGILVLVGHHSNALTSDDWTAPKAMTVEKVGPYVSDDPSRLGRIDNLDCSQYSYLSTDTNGALQMLHGCFLDTSFGSVDVRNNGIGFSGAEDKLVKLIPFSPNQILLPWPGSTSMLSMESNPTGGAYLQLYRDVMPFLKSQYSVLGKVVAKQLTARPGYSVRDAKGAVITVNPGVLTFSGSAAWLVIEVPGGGFARVNAATLDVVYFARSAYAEGTGIPGLNDSQLAISDDGRYVAVVNTTLEKFRVYDLQNCSFTDGAQQECPSYNYWPFIKNRVPDLSLATKVRFVNNGQLSFVGLTAIGESNYRLAPADSINSLLDYLALGDSYTSGQGAYSYAEGTDTAYNGCHQSTKAYPRIVGNRLYSSAGNRSAACAGATTNDILPSSPNDYAGQAKDGQAYKTRSSQNVEQILASFLPGQLPQSQFMTRYQPAVTTVSIGGNDIGFGKILEACASPHVARHVNSQNICYDTYEDRLELSKTIDKQKDKLKKLVKHLQEKAPASRIYVIGYPQIAVDTGSCGLNVLLSTGELGLSIDIITHLNAVLSQAAKESGVNYVDISQALKGHRLCESSSVAVNGMTYGNDAGVTINIGQLSLETNFIAGESYHPNSYGQELIAEAILQKTNKFASPVQDAAPTVDNDAFLNKPKSGRPTGSTVYAETVKTRKAAKDSTITLAFDGKQAGLLPDHDYNVSIGQGSEAVSTGVVRTDENGQVNDPVWVPPGAPSGPQPVVVSGENQVGDPVRVIDVIYIIVTSDDYDGDGIANNLDSCPTITNSHIDSDNDGVDDACDNQIATSTPSGDNPGPNPPVTPAGPTSPGDGGASAPGPTSQGAQGADSSDPAVSNASGSLAVAEPVLWLSAGPSNLSVAQKAISANFQQLTTSPLRTGRNLVGATKNPQASGSTLQGSRLTPGPSHWPALRVINWLPWGVLLVFWLLLLLVFRLVTGRYGARPKRVVFSQLK